VSYYFPEYMMRINSPYLRKVFNTILYVEITGCRWCDVPTGEQWSERFTAHEWLGHLQKSEPWERIKNRILCMVDLAKWMQRKYRRLVASWGEA
jgi:hypothetical protein